MIQAILAVVVLLVLLSLGQIGLAIFTAMAIGAVLIVRNGMSVYEKSKKK